MEFQQRLYELRKQSGLSQEGLADLLGVSRQEVQKWEAGTSRPDLDNLAALGRYFNVSLDYLVTGQEAQVSPSQVTTTIVNNYYTPFHYEYKSKRTLFGLPLVHIRLGHRGMGVAKGILAIGNVAVGVFTLGGFSFGLLSVGGLSFGLLFSLGGWAMGALAIGGLAVGLLAFGGAAVGLFAMGGGAFGVYAAGGGALASEIAIGGSAHAPLAIGQTAEGALTFGRGADPAAVAAAIREAAHGAPKFIQHILIFLAQNW